MATLNLEKDKKLLVATIGQIIEASAELKSYRSELSTAWMKTTRRI